LTAIVVGLPSYFILKKMDRLNLYTFVFLLGLRGFIVSHFLTLGGYREVGDFWSNVRAFVGGVIGGGSFWTIVTRTTRDLKD